MNAYLDSAQKLYDFLHKEFWNGEAFIGPDIGIRFNFRFWRFIKSYLAFIPWTDNLVYMQAQGYWILANWALYDLTKDEQYKDIAAINGYKKAATDGEDLDHYLKKLNLLSRDNGRTPMQWDDTNNAGFSSETPWLPVHENHTTVNVANQQNDHNSVLNHFRKMVALRKDNLLLVYGEYEIIQEEHPTIYAYSRTLDDEQMKILLNFSELTSKINLSNLVQIKEVLINNYNELLIDKNTITLQPYQAVVLKF